MAALVQNSLALQSGFYLYRLATRRGTAEDTAEERWRREGERWASTDWQRWETRTRHEPHFGRSIMVIRIIAPARSSEVPPAPPVRARALHAAEKRLHNFGHGGPEFRLRLAQERGRCSHCSRRTRANFTTWSQLSMPRRYEQELGGGCISTGSIMTTSLMSACAGRCTINECVFETCFSHLNAEGDHIGEPWQRLGRVEPTERRVHHLGQCVYVVQLRCSPASQGLLRSWLRAARKSGPSLSLGDKIEEDKDEADGTGKKSTEENPHCMQTTGPWIPPPPAADTVAKQLLCFNTEERPRASRAGVSYSFLPSPVKGHPTGQQLQHDNAEAVHITLESIGRRAGALWSVIAGAQVPLRVLWEEHKDRLERTPETYRWLDKWSWHNFAPNITRPSRSQRDGDWGLRWVKCWPILCSCE